MPNASTASAREILTGLHEVMASKANAQTKLNQVVKIIAEAMESEVCSIYLLRDGVLELFATLGLNQTAVHVTKLAMGEGLVGTIAEDASILNLDEASRHPEFAYRPRRAKRRSTASPACRSSARSGQSAFFASSMPIRARMTMSRSRRSKPSPWCSPS
jgi:phosphotransferase system enzyme I (PtsP)